MRERCCRDFARSLNPARDLLTCLGFVLFHELFNGRSFRSLLVDARVSDIGSHSSPRNPEIIRLFAFDFDDLHSIELVHSSSNVTDVQHDVVRSITKVIIVSYKDFSSAVISRYLYKKKKNQQQGSRDT